MKTKRLLILASLLFSHSHLAFSLQSDQDFCLQSASDYYPKTLKEVHIMVNGFANPVARETIKSTYATVIKQSYVEECVNSVEAMVLKESANFVTQYINQNSMQDLNVTRQLVTLYSQMASLKQQYGYSAADNLVNSLQRLGIENFSTTKTRVQPSEPTNIVQPIKEQLPQITRRLAPPPNSYDDVKPKQKNSNDPCDQKRQVSEFRDEKGHFKLDEKMERLTQEAANNNLELAKKNYVKPISIYKQKETYREPAELPKGQGVDDTGCLSMSQDGCRKLRPLKNTKKEKTKKKSEWDSISSKTYASCLTKVRVPNSFKWEREDFPAARFKLQNHCHHEVHFGYCSNRSLTANVKNQYPCGTNGDSNRKYYRNGGKIKPNETFYKRFDNSLAWTFAACRNKKDLRFPGERNIGKKYGCAK